MIRNILIYGVGGVGGYFGGKLAAHFEQTGGVDVSFVARGEHLERIQQSGLILKTSGNEMICRPKAASWNIKELARPDLVLLCVKGYDLEKAVLDIAQAAGENTIVIPLLNGVDIYERIRKVWLGGIVLPACVYVGTHIERPGVVSQNGGAAKIIFGPDPKLSLSNPESVLGLFKESGIESQWLPDPYPEIWGKYLFISAYGLVTVYSGKSIGEVFADPELHGQVKGIMREVAEIAANKGIKFADDAIEATLNKAKQFPPETRTSFQRDVEAGKKNEGELFGGTIVRLGRELNIPVPVTSEIYDGLKNLK